MGCDCEQLLSQAREELYVAKMLTRQVRNLTKTVASALDDSERRLDLLLARIENPTPKEAQDHERDQLQRAVPAGR